MKLKPLIKMFSFDSIQKECDREGWRLPTLAEVKEAKLEHSIIWVADKPTDSKDWEHHHRFYDSSNPDVEMIANKMFMLNVVVVVQEKVCANCVHLNNNWYCEVYDLDIKNSIGCPVSEFGCTPNFKAKRNCG